MGHRAATARHQRCKFTSSQKPGFHTVITPENSPCRYLWLFRLNLESGGSHRLEGGELELSAAVIHGTVGICVGDVQEQLQRFDSFYVPGGIEAAIVAREPSVLYIGGAPCEGIGAFFTRRYDPNMPFGKIRQLQGTPPFRREVFMTVDQEVAASRLISGFTWGDEGQWTSWPPHQHDDQLEEVYCYFDIPSPKFALHISYTEPGLIEQVHPVSTGDCVVIPRGYHPTVAMPGVRSSYFWVMAAQSQASRRYDLAVPDPVLTKQ